MIRAEGCAKVCRRMDHGSETASYMPLGRKLKTLLLMRGDERLLVFEALVMLALARLVLQTIHFRHVAPWLERAPEAQGVDEALARHISNAVTIAARNAPWNAVCLPQAMAAKAMLARRGCGSSFHLGAGLDANGKLVAHAWLEAGDIVIIGGGGMTGMKRLARFG